MSGNARTVVFVVVVAVVVRKATRHDARGKVEKAKIKVILVPIKIKSL